MSVSRHDHRDLVAAQQGVQFLKGRIHCALVFPDGIEGMSQQGHHEFPLAILQHLLHPLQLQGIQLAFHTRVNAKQHKGAVAHLEIGRLLEAGGYLVFLTQELGLADHVIDLFLCGG